MEPGRVGAIVRPLCEAHRARMPGGPDTRSPAFGGAHRSTGEAARLQLVSSSARLNSSCLERDQPGTGDHDPVARFQLGH
jgi:hypothetical protein